MAITRRTEMAFILTFSQREKGLEARMCCSNFNFARWESRTRSGREGAIL